jgi:hypothetical protein
MARASRGSSLHQLAAIGLALSLIAMIGVVFLLGWAYWQIHIHRPAEKAGLQEGWTVFRFTPPAVGYSPGGDMVVDGQDRVWVAWGLARSGVSVYDGSTWTTYHIGNSGLSSDDIVIGTVVDSCERGRMAPCSAHDHEAPRA